jgi:hypothetical protein
MRSSSLNAAFSLTPFAAGTSISIIKSLVSGGWLTSADYTFVAGSHTLVGRELATWAGGSVVILPAERPSIVQGPFVLDRIEIAEFYYAVGIAEALLTGNLVANVVLGYSISVYIRNRSTR